MWPGLEVSIMVLLFFIVISTENYFWIEVKHLIIEFSNLVFELTFVSNFIVEFLENLYLNLLEKEYGVLLKKRNSRLC